MRHAEKHGIHGRIPDKGMINIVIGEITLKAGISVTS
jgi:hypothetical protein